MNKKPFPALDITDHWARLNDELVTLLDYVPDERMDWSPKPALWSFRGILLHTIMARDNWLGSVVKDGEQVPNVLETAQLKEGMRRELRRSWDRLLRFLADPANLSKEYPGEEGGQE